MTNFRNPLRPDQHDFIRRDQDQYDHYLSDRFSHIKNQLQSMRHLQGAGYRPGPLLTTLLEEALEEQCRYQRVIEKVMHGGKNPEKVLPHQGHIYFMERPRDRMLSLARLEKRHDLANSYLQTLDALYRKEMGYSFLDTRHPEFLNTDQTHEVPVTRLSEEPIGALPRLYWKWRNHRFNQRLDAIESEPNDHKYAHALNNLYQTLTDEMLNARKNGTVQGFTIPSTQNPQERHEIARRLLTYRHRVEKKMEQVGHKPVTVPTKARDLQETASPMVEQKGQDSLWGRLRQSLGKTAIISTLFNNHNHKPATSLRGNLMRQFSRYAGNDAGQALKRSGPEYNFAA